MSLMSREWIFRRIPRLYRYILGWFAKALREMNKGRQRNIETYVYISRSPDIEKMQ
jgi:hypothetical protein